MFWGGGGGNKRKFKEETNRGKWMTGSEISVVYH